MLVAYDATLIKLTCNAPPWVHAWQFGGSQQQHVSVAEIQGLNWKKGRYGLATLCSGIGEFSFLL